MPDVREVYEMVTKQKPAEPGALQRQQKRQVRAVRNKKIGAFAVVAVLVLAAGAVLLSLRRDDFGPAPADSSTESPVDPAAVKVATGFIDAFGALDVPASIGYLADGADVSGIVALGDPSFNSTPRDLRRLMSWFGILGYEQTVGSCETSSLGADTIVRCPIDVHQFRSNELGVGPYGDNTFDVRVRPRGTSYAVVSASINFAYETNGFSAKSWEPFARWVSATHPEEVTVLYTDRSQSLPRVNARTMPLWDERMTEYVKDVNAGNVG